jgi:hypothetical protein
MSDILSIAVGVALAPLLLIAAYWVACIAIAIITIAYDTYQDTIKAIDGKIDELYRRISSYFRVT